MSRSTRTLPVVFAIAVMALAGCTAATPASTPSAAPATSGPCEKVTVVVDFGVLKQPSIKACVSPGLASDVLKEASVTTVGTADYGNQVVCRVNNEPTPEETVTIPGQPPFVESCNTLNSVAYWALWVKTSSDAKWDYAQDGVTTLKLTAGESVGLVYTPGTESTPPGN
ncbi:MAG: hypothetical protein ABJA94_03980 [Rhodoglobus sp.]